LPSGKHWSILTYFQTKVNKKEYKKVPGQIPRGSFVENSHKNRDFYTEVKPLRPRTKISSPIFPGWYLSQLIIFTGHSPSSVSSIWAKQEVIVPAWSLSIFYAIEGTTILSGPLSELNNQQTAC
jgi:hypothetical protein